MLPLSLITYENSPWASPLLHHAAVGLFFALLAPLAGWGNDWFVGKGLQPGSVLSRSKLNRIITHEQLLPDEDYE
eukprot:1144331-Pelagomonas_calceolata.AAC.1